MPITMNTTHEFTWNDDGPRSVRHAALGEQVPVQLTRVRVTYYPDGLFDVDAEGRILRKDGQVNRTYGYSVPADVPDSLVNEMVALIAAYRKTGD